jgi:N-acetylneuraminate synthase
MPKAVPSALAEATQASHEVECHQLALLSCMTGYPALAEDYNLSTIPDMMERFGLFEGLSDHTLDNTTASTSVAMGASIIEKHFTLDRGGGGPDDSLSLKPADLAALCQGAKTSWQAMGRVDYERKSSEQENGKFSLLYRITYMKVGDGVP